MMPPVLGVMIADPETTVPPCGAAWALTVVSAETRAVAVDNVPDKHCNLPARLSRATRLIARSSLSRSL